MIHQLSTSRQTALPLLALSLLRHFERQLRPEEKLRHRVVHLGGEALALLQGGRVPRLLLPLGLQFRTLERGAELPPHRRQKGERVRVEPLAPRRREVENPDRATLP